ncbi:MAG: ABC transporter substrate-binding protein [Gemmatimonadetes bacterium]|nr:ABC transporter substrate-binding protein [Gemmatimonadota bacterium]MBT6147961.1 ABC transporter substrate-binding protein [Gemmatimonadota bacterium]MBT7862104.1 ABC transporter substrate-binding protein [Gemmatimonadota bacterium]
MRRFLPVLGVGLVLGSGFLGCGGGESAPSQTLVYGRGSDSVGLDPALETDGESFKICDNIYETLVSYAPGSTEVVPQLAHSWTVSADGLDWVFHLRTDVHFHDGTPFNAEAMLFSLGRQFFADHPFHKLPAGAYQYWKDMGMDDIVADMSAPNDSTFVIRLKEPNAPFLSNLGMNFCAAVSPTAVRRHGADYFKHPVGTGPFRFVEWLKDERIVLSRHEAYWAAPAHLERLVFRSIQDPSVRYLELRSGAIQGMDNLSPEFLDDLRADENIELLTQPGMNIGYLAMNMEKPPYDDRRVRIAINHAVNKQSLVDNFYGGLAEAAKNPIPPMMWGYNDEIEPYSHDPERARQLLAEAGFPNGFDTELWAMPAPRPYMPQPEKIAQAIQADLAQVGIRARIVTLEWATYLDKVFSGQHDMCLLGWTGDNGDPDNFLYVLLDKTAAVKPAQNVAFYKSDRLHELLVEARIESDIDRRTKLYREAQALIHHDAPWVPLVHATQTAAFRRGIDGFQLHPTGSKWFQHTRLAIP